MFDEMFDKLKTDVATAVLAELKPLLTSDGQRYFTILQAATYMGCSYQQVRHLAKMGAFDIKPLGTQKRVIDRHQIDAYMASLPRVELHSKRKK